MTFLKYSFRSLRGTYSSPILPLMWTFTSLRHNETQKLLLSILVITVFYKKICLFQENLTVDKIYRRCKDIQKYVMVIR